MRVEQLQRLRRFRGAYLGHSFVRLAFLAVILAGPPTFGVAEQSQAPRIHVLFLPRGGDPAVEAAFETHLRNTGIRIEGLERVGLHEAPEETWHAMEERARQLELEMRFRDAARVWREYRDTLLDSPCAVLALERLAGAQVSLASSWVESGELELAGIEFRRALGIDRGLSVGPVYSPRVRIFFDEAGLEGPGIPLPPTDDAFDEILVRTGADGFLWVALAMEQGGWTLVRRLRVSHAADATTEVRRHLLSGPVPDATELRSEAARIAAELGLVPSLDGKRERGVSSRRRWIVIGVAGTASVALAGIVAAHALTPARVEVVVRY